MTIYKVIGSNIKELRKNKGLYQRDLAAILGVSHVAVSKWESGTNKIDVDVLEAIASYFGIRIGELFIY